MNPIEVVTGLLVQSGKVLMCERSPEKIYPLHWEFPGGKVEAGERLSDAVIREIREELHVECHSLHTYFEDTMTYSNGFTYHVTFFVINMFSGDPVNTEFNSIDWFTSEELRNILHLSGNKQVIEKLIAEGIPAQ
ncbi:MAG TPA: NUDIX domain-containing protein [Candidatus Kapabacteria bacterium]|nr:NUDIX domain-containing protein [Candidatus Kapabacteria bacterium]